MTLFITTITSFVLFFSPLAHGKTVRLLVEDSWPPFAFKKDNTPVGMSIDIVRAAFKNVDEEIELVQVPYPRCLAQTANGKFVGCFNSAHSKEMDKDFLFPKEPLFKSKGLIIANTVTSKIKIARIKDLEGRTVALPTGFPFGKEFDENNKITKMFTANDQTNLMMLKSNRISFVAIDEYVYYYYLKTNPDFKGQFQVALTMSEEPIFVHFAKKNKDSAVLMKKLDMGLAMLKASGRYNEILESWVGIEGQKRVQMFSRLPKSHSYDLQPVSIEDELFWDENVETN
ncbi:MAG: amino acid ABC transporter substrate-binding protein [Bdellovibrio sp.]|nr:amino acid ABC transporter substrate-binding protein [Bdellovibrio sp.]